ncbi:MAG: T9SS type A sorting domain-containing protein [Calditrichaeota bacterium]|nr:T9SS type A sorting domain-containing protein [Calditrichota bacterium]
MRKRFLAVGLVTAFAVLLAVVLYYARTGWRAKPTTWRTESEAAEGTKEDPLARKRHEWFCLRDPATNRVPREIGLAELQFVKGLAKRLAPQHQPLTVDWVARGPYNVGGRTKALAIDVTDENVILAGGVSGGMWKSTDGGRSWRKTTAPDQLHSVSCIAQNRSPGREHIWYYGTGESYPAGGTAAHLTFSDAFYRGDGIFKSTDGGESWSLLPATVSGTPEVGDAFDYVFGLETFAQDGVLAATSNGLFRSDDGGASWRQVLHFGEKYRSTEVAVTPSGLLYATIGGIGPDNGVYTSADGLAWEKISPPQWPDTTQRTAIGIACSNENVVYFLSYLTGLKTKLWKYERNRGWTDLTANLPWGGEMITYGGHMMIVKVKPDDENVLFVGTVGLHRSRDGGHSFEPIGAYSDFHVDQHAIVFLPSNPRVMLVGNDGGVFKTEDNLAEPTHDPRSGEYHIPWQSLNNGYLTTQFYSVSIDHATPGSETILGGTQDNAFLFTKVPDPLQPWQAIFGGAMDGGFTAIAHGGDYYATQAGSFAVWRFDFPNGQLRWTNITPEQASGGTLWMPPFLLDAHDQKIMYLPWQNQLWRNSDLTAIPYVFPPAPTSVNWERLEKVSNGQITALGMSEAQPRRLYYATFSWTPGGKLFRLDNPHLGQPQPEEITGSNFPYFPWCPSIGCIAVDPRDANRLLVAFPNYRVISIYASQDGGNTWTPVAGNLEQNPDGSGSGPSVRWIAILYVEGQPVYFAGTSMGLFSTTRLDSMNTVWVQEGAQSIGNVVVDMIDVRQSDGFVAVATHGNGVYSTYVTELPSRVPTAARPVRGFALLPAYPNPFNAQTVVSYRLSQSARVSLAIYNAFGQRICTLVAGEQPAGLHRVTWDGTDESGHPVASGVYVCILSAGGSQWAQKVAVTR